MRSILILLFVLLGGSPMLAQIEADKSKHDYGVIERTTDRVVDVKFTNTGSSKAFPLRTEVPMEFSYLWSAREVMPDSVITLRLKFHPREKGKLNKVVKVHFSSLQEPIVLKMKGEVEFVDRSENIACPSFRERPDDCCDDDPFTVKVIDAISRKPIKGAQVRVIEQGRLQRDVRTDKEGIYTETIPIGFYYIDANFEGYTSDDTTTYVNRRHNYFELELLKLPEEIAVVEEAPEPVSEPKPEPEPVVEEIETVITIPAPPPPTLEPVTVTSTTLPEDQYARNSVVFLVDVSQSMNQKGKMELLKVSMLELVDALRPIDQVALISYSSQSEVLFDMTSGDRKAEMERVIQALQAGGMTAGAKGFQSAYKMAEDHFIRGGNNQVIVATDGAFRKADQPKIEKMANKFRRNKVKTTILGIRSNNYASDNLRKIAIEGEGSFIHVADYDAALEALVEEIQKQSRFSR